MRQLYLFNSKPADLKSLWNELLNTQTPLRRKSGQTKDYGRKLKEFSPKILGPDHFASEFFLTFKEHVIPMVRNCLRDYKKMEMCPTSVMQSVWTS